MNTYTEQPVNRSFLIISGPIILSLLVHQLHLVLDTIIVGRYLGVNELAAVGNATSIVAMFLIILGGLEMGCEVIIGKYIGRKQYSKVVSYIYGTIIFSAVLAVILTIISILSKYFFFSWINLDPELWSLASKYIGIYSLAFIFIFIYDISRAFLISIGDAKTPFVIILFSSSLNIVLTLIFIQTFNMGISGVAFSTLISQMVGMFIALGIVFKRLKKLPDINLQFSYKQFHLNELISVSFPMMIQQGVVTLSALMLQTLMNPYGSDMISGYIAVTKIISLLIIVFIGFGQTLSIFTAANLGAERMDRVEKGYSFCRKSVLSYAFIIIMIIFFFSEQMIAVFIDAHLYPAASAFGVTYLKCSFILFLFYGLKIVNESLLRGYTKMTSFLLSNLSDLIIRVGGTALLLPFFNLNSFWIAYTLGVAVSFIISSIFIRYHEIILRKQSRLTI